VIRSQYKTPIEHFVGARAVSTRAAAAARSTSGPCSPAISCTTRRRSSASIGRPKGALINAAYVATRDAGADIIAKRLRRRLLRRVLGRAGMIRRYHLTHRPALAVELLARDLLAAPLSASTRTVLLDYLGAEVTETGLRGAAWLLLCAPEYQVN
jgi:hypothetical protein